MNQRHLARKRVERGLSSVREHMQEEGENLKKILEADGMLGNDP